MALVILSTTGAGIQYPVQLANTLSSLINVTIFVPSSHSSLTLSDQVEVVYYSKDDLLFPINLLYEVVGLHFEDYFDVIHLPFYSEYMIFLTLPLRLLNTPVVGTIHDPRSHSDDIFTLFGKKIDVMGYLRSLFSRTMDRLIVHGEETRRQAISIGYQAEKLQIVPHGLYSHFKVDEKQSLPPMVPDNEYVLFFGRIRQNKGYDMIPDIMSTVNRQVDREVNALVAGSPGKREMWANRVLAELEIAPNVLVYDEYVPDDLVKPLFKAASVVALPYRDASMSGVVMIAYMFDRPVVATDTGDIGRMVRNDESGLIAMPGDAEDFGNKLALLLNDDDLRQSITERIGIRKERYTWDKVAAETLDVYRAAVDR